MASGNIFDWSHYNVVQNQDANGNFIATPINWDQVMASPYKFDAMYAKFAHGNAVPGKDTDAYPVHLVRPSYRAAKGRLLRGPYHFYYYKINGRIIPAAEQAKVFRDVVGDDIGELRPMIDVECEYGFSVDFYDSATANAVVKNSLLLMDHLWSYVEAIHTEFGAWPVLYTGGWWWNKLLWQIYNNSVIRNLHSWSPMRFWDLFTYLADYTAPLDDVYFLQKDLWQTGTHPTPPVTGIPVTGGASLDIGRWVSTAEEYVEFLTNPYVSTPPALTLAGVDKRVVTLETQAKLHGWTI